MKKQITYTIAFIIVSIICCFYLQYRYTKVLNENVELKKRVIGYNKEYTNKYHLEGHFIWEVCDINKDEFEQFIIDKKIDKPILYFSLDSVECSTCVNFQIDNCNKLLKENNMSLIASSSFHKDLLKNSFANCTIYPSIQNPNKSSILSQFNLIMLLVDKSGRIIYFDIPDKFNKQKSMIFFTVVQNYCREIG